MACTYEMKSLVRLCYSFVQPLQGTRMILEFSWRKVAGIPQVGNGSNKSNLSLVLSCLGPNSTICKLSRCV